MKKLEDRWVVLIALLSAILLASHQLSSDTGFGLVGNYIYWICRVLGEAGLFVAVLMAVERYAGTLLPRWAIYGSAILASLIPFVLSVTAFDLVVGLPELGLNGGTQPEMSTARAFAYELVYLLDNHVAVCLMILLPRLINIQNVAGAKTENSEPEPDATTTTFLQSLEPPLLGEICSLEAQEHYVKIVSTEESRMVLHRFSDVVMQMSDSTGIQVHRSHWVADAAVKQAVVQGQAMKLELQDGRKVPVSRTFRAAVEQRFSALSVG